MIEAFPLTCLYSVLLIEKPMKFKLAQEEQNEDKQKPVIPVPPDEEPPAPVREPPEDESPAPINEDDPEKERLRIL